MKIRYFLLAIRPYQWLKNLFIFLPLFFDKRFFDATALFRTSVIFSSFCLVSSAVYLINDIFDRNQDILHPEKKERPVASGNLSATAAARAAAGLAVTGLSLSVFMDGRCTLTMIAYLLLTLWYMKIAKHIALLDVLCIGAFFYLRVLTGGFISGAGLSIWITACTVLLAVFLAFNKRRYDLGISGKQVSSRYSRRFLETMSLISAVSAAGTYFLYTLDPHTIRKFGTGDLLYTVPFVLCGILRYAYLITAGRKGGDPAKILIRDFPLQITVASWFLSAMAIVYAR